VIIHETTKEFAKKMWKKISAARPMDALPQQRRLADLSKLGKINKNGSSAISLYVRRNAFFTHLSA
jgi:hypothetical protein